MGIRIHLFLIKNEADWKKIKDLLIVHNDAHKNVCKDEIVDFSCFLLYKKNIYVECVSHTTCEQSVDFFESACGSDYYPPWGKPDWFHDDKIKVLDYNPKMTSFDDIKKSILAIK